MRRAIRIRLRLLSGILFIFAALICLRLYFVQVVHGADYALRAEKQYISASQELFSRGSIYFTRKDGSFLSAATLTTGFTIAMNPEQLTDPEAAYAALSPLAPIDYAAIMESAARKEDPYEVIAKRVPEAAGEAIQKLGLPGIRVERERWRSYPAGTQAAQSIGFVAYDNDKDIAGRYGLERYYEDALSRENEGLFGNFFAELFANLDSVMVDAREAREGDLVTTIEPVVEEKLQQVLLEINARYGSLETGGIIMDPKTGEIIALDPVPSFDANDFAN